MRFILTIYSILSLENPPERTERETVDQLAIARHFYWHRSERVQRSPRFNQSQYVNHPTWLFLSLFIGAVVLNSVVGWSLVVFRLQYLERKDCAVLKGAQCT